MVFQTFFFIFAGLNRSTNNFKPLLLNAMLRRKDCITSK